MSGQSITDRITAAQHSVTGSAVSKTVCKATTHEIMGPKKKHLDCEYPPHGRTGVAGDEITAGSSCSSIETHNRLSYGDGGSYQAAKPQDRLHASGCSCQGDYIVFNIQDRPC